MPETTNDHIPADSVNHSETGARKYVPDPAHSGNLQDGISRSRSTSPAEPTRQPAEGRLRPHREGWRGRGQDAQIGWKERLSRENRSTHMPTPTQPNPRPDEDVPMPSPNWVPGPPPIQEPEPERLPDETPLPNPDENDAPPQQV